MNHFKSIAACSVFLFFHAAMGVPALCNLQLQPYRNFRDISHSISVPAVIVPRKSQPTVIRKAIDKALKDSGRGAKFVETGFFAYHMGDGSIVVGATHTSNLQTRIRNEDVVKALDADLVDLPKDRIEWVEHFHTHPPIQASSYIPSSSDVGFMPELQKHLGERGINANVVLNVVSPKNKSADGKGAVVAMVITPEEGASAREKLAAWTAQLNATVDAKLPEVTQRPLSRVDATTWHIQNSKRRTAIDDFLGAMANFFNRNSRVEIFHPEDRAKFLAAFAEKSQALKVVEQGEDVRASGDSFSFALNRASGNTGPAPQQLTDAVGYRKATSGSRNLVGLLKKLTPLSEPEPNCLVVYTFPYRRGAEDIQYLGVYAGESNGAHRVRSKIPSSLSMVVEHNLEDAPAAVADEVKYYRVPPMPELLRLLQ